MVMDEGTKEAIAEQLRLGAELRQKSERMGRPGGSDDDDDSDGTDGSSTDASDGEGGVYGGSKGREKARGAAMEILQSSGLADGEVPTKVSLPVPPFRETAHLIEQTAKNNNIDNTRSYDDNVTDAIDKNGNV
jgi:U3 small nucleolar RNA-associated protein 14